MGQGNIIYLNGTSSSGKSSIAFALQELMEEYYIHTGIDHFLARIPEKFRTVSDGENPATFDGLMWVSPDGGKHVSEIRLGSTALTIFSGMYSAYAALTASGANIIVDDVLFDARVFEDAVNKLHSFNVLFVGVRCPFAVAEQREQERGDRFLGLVKAHYDIIHAHGVYDVEVDTSVLTPMACALQIKDRLQNGPPPDAFQRLWDKRN